MELCHQGPDPIEDNMKLVSATRESAYSARDVLVLVFCVGFLLLNVAAIGSAGRRRAKEAVCRSNLRQWGIAFQKFTNDNDGYFINSDDPYYSSNWRRGRWMLFLRRQYQGDFMPHVYLCPEATRPPYRFEYDRCGGPFNAYGLGGSSAPVPVAKGSYGANAWIYKPTPAEIEDGDIQDRPVEWNWQTPHVQNADRIPVLADTMYLGGGPISGDPAEYAPGLGIERSFPPLFDGEWSGAQAEMKHFCINRHNGGVNMLFMDWSVRKVGLKELWKLKWHREFNTDGPWTQAGGVRSIDWPEWMREFKDY